MDKRIVSLYRVLLKKSIMKSDQLNAWILTLLKAILLRIKDLIHMYLVTACRYRYQ